jgi:hypothetical protein
MLTWAGPWMQWLEHWSATWRKALSSYWVRLNVGIVIHRKVKGYGGSICDFHTICTFIYFKAHHTLGPLKAQCNEPLWGADFGPSLKQNERTTLCELPDSVWRLIFASSYPSYAENCPRSCKLTHYTRTSHHSYSYSVPPVSQYTSTSILAHNVHLTLYLKFSHDFFHEQGWLDII